MPREHRKAFVAAASSIVLLGLGVVLGEMLGWVAVLVGSAGLAIAAVVRVLERRDAPLWSNTLGSVLAISVLSALGVGVGAGLLIGGGTAETQKEQLVASRVLTTNNQSGGTNINGNVNVEAGPHGGADVTEFKRDKPFSGAFYGDARAAGSGFDPTVKAKGYVTEARISLTPNAAAVANFVVLLSDAATFEQARLGPEGGGVATPLSCAFHGEFVLGEKRPINDHWTVAVLTAKPEPNLKVKAAVNVEEASPEVCAH